MQSIALTIKQARKAKNLTQAELAEACGISRTSITNIEVGNADPSLMTLQLIAMRLDMEVCLMPSDDDRFLLLNQLIAENKQLTERIKTIDKLASEIRKISHIKETL